MAALRAGRRWQLAALVAALVAIGATVVFLSRGSGEPNVATKDDSNSTSSSSSIASSVSVPERVTGSVVSSSSDSDDTTASTPTSLPEVLGEEPLLLTDDRSELLRPGKRGLFAMNPDGTALTLLFEADLDSFDACRWSPDHSQIACATWSQQIAVWNRDGTGERVVTDPLKGAARSPSWSPDGDRLAYSCRTDDEFSHVCVVRADGSGPSEVVAIGGNSSWSPDGTKLVIDTYQGPITVIDLATRATTDLVDPDNTGTDFSSSDYLVSPAWSPDGRMIVFTRKPPADDTYGLWLVGADGSDAHPLTSGIYVDHGVWSPDGDAIAMRGHDLVGNVASVYLVDPRNGFVTVVPGTTEPMTLSDW